MWTASALAPELRPYQGQVYRVVEGQHVVSTNRLAANSEDQALLEVLADAAKPDLPVEAQGRHWLIAAPFRYYHGFGSRFRGPGIKPGIFYAAEEQETAIAEAAWWRLRAIRAAAPLPQARVAVTMIAVEIAAQATLDLTVAPLNASEADWINPDDYGPCQALAAAARTAYSQAIRARSVRTVDGVCVAALTPAAIKGDPQLVASLTFSDDGLGESIVAAGSFPLAVNRHYRRQGSKLVAR